MSAIPMIPGHAYRVRYHGQAIMVLATHPCDALAIALDVFEMLV